eukprot:1288096-Lingulodinium_polyedra.AAC.1
MQRTLRAPHAVLTAMSMMMTCYFTPEHGRRASQSVARILHERSSRRVPSLRALPICSRAARLTKRCVAA